MKSKISVWDMKLQLCKRKLQWQDINWEIKANYAVNKSQLLDINSSKTGLCNDIFKNAQKHTFEKNNQSGKFCIRIICKMSLFSHMSTSKN